MLTITTDHCAFLSTLKEHRTDKIFLKKLFSRSFDWLLPYIFSNEHMPGEKMGLFKYISRNQFEKAKKIPTYDEHFVVAIILKIQAIS